MIPCIIMRPIRQTSKLNCGPVSLFNALILHGKKPNLQELEEDMKHGTHPSGGTYTKDWLKSIRKHFQLKKILRDKLDQHGSYFVFMGKNRRGKISGHFVFIKDGRVYNLDRKDFPVKTDLLDWKIRAAVLYSPFGSECEVWRSSKK